MYIVKIIVGLIYVILVVGGLALTCSMTSSMVDAYRHATSGTAKRGIIITWLIMLAIMWALIIVGIVSPFDGATAAKVCGVVGKSKAMSNIALGFTLGA